MPSSVASTVATSTFEPQPLQHPLNDAALASLSDLTTHRALEKKIQERFAVAIKEVTDIATGINERAFDRRQRYEKAQARRRERGQQEGEDDVKQKESNEKFQADVETLTNKMDLKIRGIIDDLTWLEDLPNVIKDALQSSQPSTQHNQSPTPVHSTRRSNDDDGNDDNDDDNHADEGEYHHADRKPVPPPDAPHLLLESGLLKQQQDWSSKTPTEKYARNNEYTGFYRMVYEARHPEEHAPPLPNPNLWFAAEESRDSGTATQRRRRRGSRSQSAHDPDHTHEVSDEGSGGDNDDETEIQVASEKLSLKCPITLLYYQDPVSSVNCNHNYESSAIHSMFRSTTDHAPWTSEQLAQLAAARKKAERDRIESSFERIPMVKCPECNVPMLEGDLRPNPILKRRTQRALKQAEHENGGDMATSDIEADEVDVDHNDPQTRGTQRRPLNVGSSPASALSSTRRSLRAIKAEGLSGGNLGSPRARNRTTGRAARSRIVDLDDDDEA